MEAVIKAGGKQQRVKPGDFMSMPVVQPSRPAIEALAERIVPTLRLIESGRLEARTLAETRDALLPKLLSGEIRLTAREPVLEKVG